MFSFRGLIILYFFGVVAVFPYIQWVLWENRWSCADTNQEKTEIFYMNGYLGTDHYSWWKNEWTSNINRTYMVKRMILRRYMTVSEVFSLRNDSTSELQLQVHYRTIVFQWSVSSEMQLELNFKSWLSLELRWSDVMLQHRKLHYQIKL